MNSCNVFHNGYDPTGGFIMVGFVFEVFGSIINKSIDVLHMRGRDNFVVKCMIAFAKERYCNLYHSDLLIP